jgi:hypothetical protein
MNVVSRVPGHRRSRWFSDVRRALRSGKVSLVRREVLAVLRLPTSRNVDCRRVRQ